MSEHANNIDTYKATKKLLTEAFENDDMQLFGELLIEYLDSHNMTMTEFADSINVSRPTMYRMFSPNGDVRRNTIDKVLNGLGMKLSAVSM